MICPLMSTRVTRVDKDSKVLTPTVINCVPECAWWDKVGKCCIVVTKLKYKPKQRKR